jgi:hypothetical protein
MVPNFVVVSSKVLNVAQGYACGFDFDSSLVG